MKWKESIMKGLAVLIAMVHTALCVDPTVIITETNPPSRLVKGNINQVTIEKNKDAYMTCVVYDKPKNRQVAWQGVDSTGYAFRISNGQSSEDPFKYQVDQPSAISWRLKVQNVQIGASDIKYVCMVQIGEMKWVTDERQLRVVESPKILDLLTDSDMTVNAGDPLELKCNSTGYPAPKVKWERLAGGLLPSGGREHADYVMNMGLASKEHRGYYKCTAQNDAGSESRIVNVKVKFKPSIVPVESVIGQAKGYRKMLMCVAEAYPVVSEEQFLWTKGGQPIQKGKDYKIVYLIGASDRVSTILTIYNVQNRDFGQYTCSASNSEGDGSATIMLQDSPTPTPDLTNRIVSSASVVSISLTTLIMILIVGLLHKL